MARGRRLRATARLGNVADEFSDVADFAAALPEKFLACRDFGHNWRRHGVHANNDGTFDRTLRCGQCNTYRIMVLNSRGVVERSRYEHPEGYLSTGLGRLTGDGRGVLRLEAIMRELDKKTAKAS